MRIGIDLGGTKIEGIALGDDGRQLAHHRIATPTEGYQPTIGAIVSVVHFLENMTGQRGSIGIGTPGAISPATGLIKNSNSTALNGKPLDRDLQQALGRHIRIGNDADCFAMSEATDGAAAGARVVFGVIIGTGCGGGIVIDGKLLTGANAIGGEWGHNPLPAPRDGEPYNQHCYCGRIGCIETFISGTGLSWDHQRFTGHTVTAEQIVALAAQGDAECRQSLDRYTDRLARALGSVINIIDPDVIVLGGGMSNYQELYARVPQIWAPYIFSDAIATKLVPPKFGAASGVRGAAWLWRPGES